MRRPAALVSLALALVLGWSATAGATTGHHYTCHEDEGCHEDEPTTTTTARTTTTTAAPTTTTTTAPTTTTTAPAPTTTAPAPSTTTTAAIGLERAPWWPPPTEPVSTTDPHLSERPPTSVVVTAAPTPIPTGELPYTGAPTRTVALIAGISIGLGWALISLTTRGSRSRAWLARLFRR